MLYSNSQRSIFPPFSYTTLCYTITFASTPSFFLHAVCCLLPDNEAEEKPSVGTHNGSGKLMDFTDSCISGASHLTSLTKQHTLSEYRLEREKKTPLTSLKIGSCRITYNALPALFHCRITFIFIMWFYTKHHNSEHTTVP